MLARSRERIGSRILLSVFGAFWLELLALPGVCLFVLEKIIREASGCRAGRAWQGGKGGWGVHLARDSPVLLDCWKHNFVTISYIVNMTEF